MYLLRRTRLKGFRVKDADWENSLKWRMVIRRDTLMWLNHDEMALQDWIRLLTWLINAT
jgi:hypothetical protein